MRGKGRDHTFFAFFILVLLFVSGCYSDGQHEEETKTRQGASVEMNSLEVESKSDCDGQKDIERKLSSQRSLDEPVSLQGNGSGGCSLGSDESFEFN